MKKKLLYIFIFTISVAIIVNSGLLIFYKSKTYELKHNQMAEKLVSDFREILPSKEKISLLFNPEEKEIIRRYEKYDDINKAEEENGEEKVEITSDIIEDKKIDSVQEIKKQEVKVEAITPIKEEIIEQPSVISEKKKIIEEKEEAVNSKVEEPKIKQIISDEQSEEEDILETKYGTKKKKISTYHVIIYDDASVDKTLMAERIYYDKSGYNATTNDLLNEAREVSTNNYSLYMDVAGYVNGYRNDVGVQNIELDKELSIAASIRAIEMAYTSTGYQISHTRPNGSSCFSIFSDLNINNYWNMGENIAAGQRTATAVTNSWYNSQGHRANMENANYTKIGIGMYELDGIRYWVQIFAG